jgi:PIN domain nuclease of toxin-antitoxin system
LIEKAMLGGEVIVAKDNKPVAKIVPLRPAIRKPGTGKGKILYISPDFEAPLARYLITIENCYLSIASCWEPGVKAALGRIQFDGPLTQFLAEELSANTIPLLPIEFRHVMQVANLPLHHRDPFDRLLITQALDENLSVVSIDRCFDASGIKCVW